MGIFTKALDSARSMIGSVRFPGKAFVFFNWSGPDEARMSKDIGDGTSSDVLMSPIKWICRAIVKAPWQATDEEGEVIENSALINLLNRPNPFYDGKVLLAGTTLSMNLDGNAYWIAALNAEGVPVELWYAPHTNVEPKWPTNDNTKFITHYEYEVAGSKQKIAPAGISEDDKHPECEEGLVMVHFREGIDLDNLRKGLSPLKGLLREVWTDNEAAVYSGSLLKNMGIPGVVVSPADSDSALTPDEAQVFKDKLTEEYTGEGRGKPLVALGPTRVEQFGFNPQEMELTPLRDIAEERVTAALGVPAAVVGFGAGLQQTKVGATMKELRQMAWDDAVIPLQSLLAGEATNILGPCFESENIKEVSFDNDDIEVLRENQDTKANRVQRLGTSGFMTRAEVRMELGLETTPADDVYLMPLTLIEVPRNQPRTVEDDPDAAKRIGDWLKQSIKHDTGRTHTHDPIEEAIIDKAPKGKPTARAQRAANSLARIARSGGLVMVPGLERAFESLGQSALSAATEVLGDEDELEQRSSNQDSEEKQLSPSDILLAEQIAALMDTETAQQAVTVELQEGYLIIGKDVASTIGNTLGVEFELADQAQAQFMRAGGSRAGLIDMEGQSRDALFDALARGREQGLSGKALARFISEHVEGGPWTTAAIRAQVIARTEGAHAANFSTLEVARNMPETDHVQVFDNRSGTNDEACERADGAIITLEQAESIGLAHPNCTRGFVPINNLLLDEMGISGPMSRIVGEGE